MSATSRIRHSIAGRWIRRSIHTVFRLRHPGSDPLNYRLPGKVDIRLYPHGEVAEWLAFPRLFEATELALVSAALKAGMKVVDAGANIGLYSILAAKLVGPTGTVWSFEPAPETFARLERNLSLNECDRVQSFRLALSDVPDILLPLRSDRGFGDAYRYLAHDSAAPNPDDPGAALVSVTTLDQWATRSGAHDVDFLKIDVEGGEYRLLLGAREFLKSNPRVTVLFECEADWCDRSGCRQEDAMDLLESLGFGLFAWETRSGKWVSDRPSLLSAGMLWACRDPRKLPARPNL